MPILSLISLYFYNKNKTEFLKISRKIKKKTANVWTVNVSPTTVFEFSKEYESAYTENKTSKGSLD